MNSRSLSTIAVVTLLLLGGIGMALRYRALRAEQIAAEDSRWELTYVVQFRAEGLTGQEIALVRLAVPLETPYCELLSADPIVPNPNLRRRLRTFTSTGNHYIELTTKQASTTADPYIATANFVLQLSPRPNWSRRLPLQSLSPDAESLFLDETDVLPTLNDDVRQVAQQAEAESETKAQQIQWIFEFCSTIDSTPQSALDDVASAVQNRTGTPVARARTMVTLCRALGIPARLVTGFIISQGAAVKPHVWAEAYSEQEWKPFDPTNGYSYNLPMNYVPVRRNADQVIYRNKNVTLTEDSTKFSIKRLPPDARILTGEIAHPSQILDLRRLPVPMHDVMSLLLLLPFGALITAFVRNVVGVQTFGTFAPALLAMSFIYADWRTGLAILLVVMTAGLVGRLFLERLRLLMVPRLSIILTLAILCVVFCVSSFDFMGLTPSAQAVLLPMVILTILIERFHVTVEEDGLMFAVKLAVGTIVVAMLCFAVLAWEDVGAWVLKYPEVHFFTIAAFIVLGRYAGYRLTELWRFRDLVEPSEAAR
jgi:transglutaminase-like putative cysteine protease